MLLDVLSSDFAKHVTKIRQDAGEKNFAGAKAVFEAATSGGAELNYFVYNAWLDMCVNRQDLKAAEDIVDQTMQAGMIYVVSFDTLIKAYLQRGKFVKASRVDRRDEEGGPAADPGELQRARQRDDRQGQRAGPRRCPGHRRRRYKRQTSNRTE